MTAVSHAGWRSRSRHSATMPTTATAHTAQHSMSPPRSASVTSEKGA